MPSRWQAGGASALAGLAVLLPFELKQPILRLGPLAVTNVELALYLALLVWGLGRAALGRRGLRWTGAHSAVVAWAGALVLSAAFAPAERGEAVKFALRSLGGCALFFASADLVRTPGQAAPVLMALAAGGVVSALAALAEVGLPGAAAALLPFKTQTTLVGSFVRAGGTFQYANIAAMYWEAALALLVGLGGWWAARAVGGAAWRWAAVLAAPVLITSAALVLSASRAGLLVAAAGIGGLAWLGHRQLRALRLPAALGLAGLAATAAAGLAASPWLGLRLQSEHNTAWYRTGYTVASPALSLEAGEVVTVTVTVRNEGLLTWPAQGSQSVLLGYHWHDPARDQTVVFNGCCTPLPHDVPPGGQITVAALVLAPDQPGSYTLQLDMVQEEVLWFSAHGDETGDVPAHVRPASAGAAPALTPPPAPQPAIQQQPTRLELWGAGVRMWLDRPMLGVGPDNFRRLYGAYLGLERFDDRVHANNLYVETLATLGLAGAIALAGLMAGLWRGARRAWRGASREALPARALTAGLLAGLAAFFLHGLADYFFEFTPTYGLFWLLAGMAAGLGTSSKAPTE